MLMKSVGDTMIVGLKDSSKLIGISIITCCAVMVCTMFLNYYLDIISVENQITSEIAAVFYNAQVSTSKVVCLVTGGCLFATAVIMLIFYIKHYIDTHGKELGILKAIGYSNLKIAKGFWVFGTSTFIGSAAGFGGAFILMPWLYELQNKDKILPEISIHFHYRIFIYFVVLPTAAFALLAVLYAWLRLKLPVLMLLKNNTAVHMKTKKHRVEKSSGRFIDSLKRDTLKSKKTLLFFIVFSSFCFSAMTQMSFSMKDLSSEMMGAMMLIIGLVLAFTTLYLAITTVINENTQTIAMMRVFGYSQKECCRAILGGYRPFSYIGFALGTVYQYALLRLMVDIVFKDVEGIPVYKFDFPVMFISLAVFIAVYEIIMYAYSEKIKKISLKEIMID